MMEAKSRSARLVEVIEVKTAVGKGNEDDPKRIITEYWSKEGLLLAVNDPHLISVEQQISPDQ